MTSGLPKALSHPLRQRILQRLNEGGIRSPNELSRELGDPLGNVSYHVRILRELDCVELVRTEQRRGALEHYYRATAEPWLDDEQWARLPAAFRRKTLGRTLSEILEGASEASRENGLRPPGGQGRPAWSSISTSRAWKDIVALLNETHEAALRIQAESAARRGKNGADGDEPSAPSSASCIPAAVPPRRSSWSGSGPKVPRSSCPPPASHDKDGFAVLAARRAIRRARRRGADLGRRRPRGPLSSASARMSSTGW